jgi:hypothetical protein
VALAANTSPSLLSQKAVPGSKPGAARRKGSGRVPAWALKLGTFVTTFAIFGSSFGYATTHLYVTNAPLQPATVTSADTSASSNAAASTSTSTTTTLTSRVRTTSRTAVTSTRHS